MINAVASSGSDLQIVLKIIYFKHSSFKTTYVNYFKISVKERDS